MALAWHCRGFHGCHGGPAPIISARACSRNFVNWSCGSGRRVTAHGSMRPGAVADSLMKSRRDFPRDGYETAPVDMGAKAHRMPTSRLIIRTSLCDAPGGGHGQ